MSGAGRFPNSSLEFERKAAAVRWRLSKEEVGDLLFCRFDFFRHSSIPKITTARRLRRVTTSNVLMRSPPIWRKQPAALLLNSI